MGKRLLALLRKYLVVNLLSILCVAALVGLATLLVYQHITWTEPVDGYTFTEQRVTGQAVRATTSHDAAAATRLRQTINALPQIAHPTPCGHTPSDAHTPDNQFTYTYIFYLHDQPIETVTGLTNNCGFGLIQCLGHFSPIVVDGVPNVALRAATHPGALAGARHVAAR